MLRIYSLVMICGINLFCALSTEAIPGGRALQRFAQAFESLPPAALAAQDPQAVSLSWQGPTNCELSYVYVLEPSNRVKYAAAEETLERSPLSLRPGDYSLQMECVDSKSEWRSGHRYLDANGNWVEAPGSYQTIYYRKKMIMHLPGVPGGARFHLCVFTGDYQEDAALRSYRMSAVADPRYCEALGELTDHFELPFQVNMLDFIPR